MKPVITMYNGSASAVALTWDIPGISFAQLPVLGSQWFQLYHGTIWFWRGSCQNIVKVAIPNAPRVVSDPVLSHGFTHQRHITKRNPPMIPTQERTRVTFSTTGPALDQRERRADRSTRTSG